MERTSRRDARARVVGVLAEAGAVSRADLARRAALAPSTVSAVVSELHAAGLVVEPAEPVHPSERGTVGRPPVLIALHRRAGVVAGIDFGKRHLRLAISDLSHALLAERHRALDADLPAKEAIALATDGVRRRARGGRGRRATRSSASAWGCPGPVHRPSGELGNSTILPGWAGTRAAEAVAEALGYPSRSRTTPTSARSASGCGARAAAPTHMAYVKAATGIGAGLHRRRRAVRRRGRDGGRARPHRRRPRRADLPLRQPRLPGDLAGAPGDPRLAARRPRRRADAAGGGRVRRPRRRGLPARDRRRRARRSAPPWPRSATSSTRTGSSSAATSGAAGELLLGAAARIAASAARSAPRRRTSRSSRASWAIAPKCWALLRSC